MSEFSWFKTAREVLTEVHGEVNMDYQEAEDVMDVTYSPTTLGSPDLDAARYAEYLASLENQDVSPSTSELDESCLSPLTNQESPPSSPGVLPSSALAATPIRSAKKRTLTRKPIEKHTRKRRINEEKWIKVAAKYAQQNGIDGISCRGKPINKREMGTGCVNCRFRCYEKITVEERLNIFTKFWRIGDKARQWEYLSSVFQSFEPAERKVPVQDTAKIQKSREFYLQVGERRLKVCKTMFLDTFGIKKHWLETVDKKLDQQIADDGELCFNDQRGKHKNRPHAYPAETALSVKEHINLFPRVEAHYCRKDTKKEYLEEGLDVSKLYRKYEEFMQSRPNVRKASKKYYTEIFENEFNIAFHQQKKDKCATCVAYNNLSPEYQSKTEIKTVHQQHVKSKEIVRDMLKADKIKAKQDPKLFVAVYDLQKVLNTPKTNTSDMYYSRKLSIFNFTVVNVANGLAWCNVWNETTANRGSNEISSIIWNLIAEQVQNGVEEFIFYSDNCSGQNRNKIVFTMYLKAANHFNVKITHRFFEVGHGQNDGDYVHSAIERITKNRDVYSQAEWCEFMGQARVNEPFFIIKNIEQSDVFDFAKISEFAHWDKVQTSKVKEIIFKRSIENSVIVRNNIEKLDNKKIVLTFKKKVLLNEILNYQNSVLAPAYNVKIPLSIDKIKDLKNLCTKGLIPSRYHDFYNDLFN